MNQGYKQGGACCLWFCDHKSVTEKTVFISSIYAVLILLLLLFVFQLLSSSKEEKIILYWITKLVEKVWFSILILAPFNKNLLIAFHTIVFLSNFVGMFSRFTLCSQWQCTAHMYFNLIQIQNMWMRPDMEFFRNAIPVSKNHSKFSVCLTKTVAIIFWFQPILSSHKLDMLFTD